MGDLDSVWIDHVYHVLRFFFFQFDKQFLKKILAFFFFISQEIFIAILIDLFVLFCFLEMFYYGFLVERCIM